MVGWQKRQPETESDSRENLLNRQITNRDALVGSFHQDSTSTISSSSTDAPRGSSATPIAARACLPASPKISSNSIDAPSTTWGWPLKPSADATHPLSLIIRLIRSSVPT